jgi:RNA polymerase sigma factor (sigma-70 family)
MHAIPIHDDEQLIELFLVGAPDEAESAFEALVARYRPAVMRICRRVLNRHEDAEDAAQAAFVALVRNAAKIRDRRRVGAWLFGVAYWGALKMRARAARRRAVYSQVGSDVQPRQAEHVAVVGELRQIVRDEVDGLPVDFRVLVMHSYMEGRSNQEVARIVGCPIGTVKARLWRARGMLRVRLLSRVGWSAEQFTGTGA